MVKNLPVNAREAVSFPGSGRPPGGRNGNLLQCSCGQESSSSGRHKEADMTERLSMRIVRHLFDFCFQSNKPIL